MRKLATLTIVSLIAIAFYFYFKPQDNDMLAEKIELKEPIKMNKDTPSPIEQGVVNYAAEPVGSEIVNFNQYLSTRPEFDLIFGDNDPVQVFIESHEVTEESASIFIDKILDNIEDEQLSARQLFLRCNKLKVEPRKYTQGGNLMYPNDMLIYAIHKKGICHMLGSSKDPFYIYLNLARRGNMLSQLLLIDDLRFAIDSGAIKPFLNPIAYDGYRQEAKYYLENLSAKGVKKASDRLVSLYRDERYFPEDKVKQFFYAYLAEKQNRFEDMIEPWNSSDHYYGKLSEEEKQRADRMIRNIK